MTHTYTDCISNRFRNNLPLSLSITNLTSCEAQLIRLLTGTSKITNSYTQEQVTQNVNYGKLGREIIRMPSSRPIRDCLSSPLKISDLDQYLSKTNRENIQYYKLLLEEFCSYFISKQRNSFTKGFLHLYRIIEFISYSFPLIYSSYSRDYYGTFNQLKNFFSEKNELSFFESFINKVLDETLLDSELEFNFSMLDGELSKNYYRIIKDFVGQSNILNDIRNSKLSFQYRWLLQLVVNLRNRYFHFAVGGQKNIKPTEIIESDVFFQIVNEEIANWIAIIYFEILSHSVNKSK